MLPIIPIQQLQAWVILAKNIIADYSVSIFWFVNWGLASKNFLIQFNPV
jgi:hypothetical protein